MKDEKEMKIELPIRHCKRCAHKWILRTDKEPLVCPKCKSPYWDKERRR